MLPNTPEVLSQERTRKFWVYFEHRCALITEFSIWLLDSLSAMERRGTYFASQKSRGRY